jgi:hypothetical protein
LYGIGELELLPWPKERGEDIPYDLGNYPDVIEDFRNEINEKFAEQDSEIEASIRVFEDDNENFKLEQIARQNAFEETVNANVANKADAASLEEEIAARKNADNALSARITTNKSNIENNAANISKANTAIEKEVSDRVKAVEAEKQSRLVAVGAVSERITNEITRATTRENEIEATANRSMQKAEEVEDSLNNLVNNAPEALDTLEEIANYIKQDETGTAAILKDIASIREDKANRTELDTKADVSALEAEFLRAKGAEQALAGALAKKQGVLEAGENITIVGNVISATGGGGGSGSGDIVVDDALSDISTNAVQNKTVTKALEGKFDKTGGEVSGDVEIVEGDLNVKSGILRLGDSQSDETNPDGTVLSFTRRNGSYNKIDNFIAQTFTIEGERTSTIIKIPRKTGTMALNYPFIESSLSLVNTEVGLEPYAVNIIKGSALNYLNIMSVLEYPSEWMYARDLILCIQSNDGYSSLPHTTCNNKVFYPRTDADTDFAIVTGEINVYFITEVIPDKFVVSRWGAPSTEEGEV